MAKNIVGLKIKRQNQGRLDIAKDSRLSFKYVGDTTSRKYKYNRYGSGYINTDEDFFT